MLESTIESCVCDHAERHGWWTRKCQWLGRRGAPDHIFIKDGAVIFVEFKKPGKKPEGQQMKEQEKMRKRGAVVHVIDNLEAGYALFG